MTHYFIGEETQQTVAVGTTGTSVRNGNHTTPVNTHLLLFRWLMEGNENPAASNPARFNSQNLTLIPSCDTGSTGSNSDLRMLLYGLLNPGAVSAGATRFEWQFDAGPMHGQWINVNFSTGQPATLAEAIEYLDDNVETTEQTSIALPTSGNTDHSICVFAGSQNANTSPLSILTGNYIIDQQGTTGATSSDVAFMLARSGTELGLFDDSSDEAMSVGLTNPNESVILKFQLLNAATSTPTVTDVNENVDIAHGDSAVITGTGFLASGATVTISPTDDVNDVNAETQAVTAQSNTEITFTVDRGALNLDDDMFLFVTTSGADTNVDGYSTAFRPNATMALDECFQLLFTADFQFVGFVSVVSGFQEFTVTTYDSTVGYNPIVIIADPDIIVGGNSSTNSLNAYRQKKRKKLDDMAQLLKELYDLSPDP